MTSFARLVRVTWCVLWGSPDLSNPRATTPWSRHIWFGQRRVIKKYGHLSHHATTTPMRPGYPQLATGRFGRPTVHLFQTTACKKTQGFALQSSANEVIFCELLGFNRVNGPRIIGGSPRLIFRFQIRENVRLRFTRSPGSRAPGPAGFFLNKFSATSKVCSTSPKREQKKTQIQAPPPRPGL